MEHEPAPTARPDATPDPTPSTDDRGGDAALVALVHLGQQGPERALRARHETAVRPLADRVAGTDGADGADVLDESWRRLVDGIALAAGLDVPVRVAWLALVAQHGTGSRAPRPWAGGDATWHAFLELPPTWQVVLWHHEVERDPDEAVALLTGSDADSVRRWTRVARGSLRREVVRRHLPVVRGADCLTISHQLLGDLDTAASPVELQQLHVHALACGTCHPLAAAVLGIERDLRGSLAATVLGQHARWYLGDRADADAAAAAAIAPSVDGGAEDLPAEDSPADEPVDDTTVVAAPVAVPAPPRPAARTPRPARSTATQRRGGRLLVGLAAAAVVAGLVTWLPGSPDAGDPRAGAGRDEVVTVDTARPGDVAGRTRDRSSTPVGGPGAASADRTANGAASSTPAPAAPAAPAVVVDPGSDAGSRTGTGGDPGGGTAGADDPTSPGTGGGPGDGGAGGDGGDGDPGAGDGGNGSEGSTTRGPVRVSVDQDTGSATVEVTPPLLGGGLALTTPPLTGRP